jgi:uncharacterized protein (DUF2236 family)
VPDALLPADLAAFQGYLDAQLAADGPVQVGDTARDLAAAILHPPLPGELARLGLPPVLYDWTLWPSIGLLPASIREAYGFAWGPLQRAVAAWLVTGWRAWNPILPAGFRQMPQALSAERRVRPSTEPQ